jgi:hypothetical protein
VGSWVGWAGRHQGMRVHHIAHVLPLEPAEHARAWLSREAISPHTHSPTTLFPPAVGAGDGVAAAAQREQRRTSGPAPPPPGAVSGSHRHRR